MKKYLNYALVAAFIPLVFLLSVAFHVAYIPVGIYRGLTDKVGYSRFVFRVCEFFRKSATLYTNKK